MSFSGPLEDRLAIRELIDTYNDAIARLDAEAWGETWAANAEWELLGNHVQGREAIVELWQKMMGGMEFVIFQSSPGALEITGDEATGRVYAMEIMQLPGGERRHMQGRYDDGYVREAGVWRFRSRRYQVLQSY